MNDMNNVVLVGRLTKDSELKYTTSGTVMGFFSLAVNRSVKKNEKWVDEASYIDCVIFGKTAETMSKFLVKGQQACIQGELRQNRWEQDGQAKSKIDIIVNQVQLLGKKPDGASNASESFSGIPF